MESSFNALNRGFNPVSNGWEGAEIEGFESHFLRFFCQKKLSFEQFQMVQSRHLPNRFRRDKIQIKAPELNCFMVPVPSKTVAKVRRLKDFKVKILKFSKNSSKIF